MRRSLLLVPLVVAAMTACGGDDDVADSVPVPTDTPDAAAPPVSPPTSATAQPDDTRSPGTFQAVPGSVSRIPSVSSPGSASGPRGTPDELAAVDDLARRQGVEPGSITVVSSEDVTWRDGSLGCPQPGMNYTQALVPGVRVVLELDGVRYEYHAGGSRSIFLCEDPRPPVDG